MRYFIIAFFCFSAAITGCKNATESTYLPPTAYQRAVGPFFPSFAGKDSSMDACLSLTRQTDAEPPDSTLWTATAAFNVGDYVSAIGLVSLGKNALPWHIANDYYRATASIVDSTVWTVVDYNSMNFSEKVIMPVKMKCLNHADWDSVSKSSGFTIRYSGSEGRTLTISGIFSNHIAPSRDSLGFIEDSATPDTGSVTITPDMLKNIPVGSKIILEFWHDLFYSKVIAQNTVSHKIGFYTQTESDFLFTLGK